MKLIAQILKELGAEEGRAVTLCPGRLAYFRGVTAVLELGEEEVELACGKVKMSAFGQKLCIESFFQGDLILRGNVMGVKVE